MIEDDKPAPDAPLDPTRVKILTRVTIRKFEGEDTSGEPIETVVVQDEGFDEAHRKGQENATD